MGLVDYSDSDGSGSETEAPMKPASKTPTTAPKKTFQRGVDRSSTGKIVVNLGQPTKADTPKDADEPPPAKRARTAGGGRFSGFNSFLPPPKNPNATSSSAASSSQAKARPGVNLKTSAAPGFNRNGGDDNVQESGDGDTKATFDLPTPSAQPAPSIPEGQKAAEDVKITGKPLMFKPLSVSRKPAAKKKAPKANATHAPQAQAEATAAPEPAAPSAAAAAPQPPKKVSLFSLPPTDNTEPSDAPTSSEYEPMFASTTYTDHPEDGLTGDYNPHAPPPDLSSSITGTTTTSQSLNDVVSSMNLSAADRRELFGRSQAPNSNAAASSIVNFNMDTEYQHNEQLRASGEQQPAHNPVRAIMGGKHNMAQLLRNVNDQREALEESFTKGKVNRREASSKYGW